MEPKDLKNSEELKRTENTDLENSEVKSTSEEAAKPDELNTVEDEKSVEPTEDTTAEESTAEPETAKVEETAKEEPKAEVAEEPKSDSESEINSKEENTTDSTEDSNDAAAEQKTEEAPREPESKESENEQKSTESTAEKAKPVKEEKPKKREPVDYSNYSQVELVNALRDILEEERDIKVRDEIEAIKAIFYKNLNENIEADKKKFIADGGAEEDFKTEDDPYEKDIKDLLKKYRYIRIEHNKKLESEKEENLEKKYEVIEKIKGLINNEESINKTFNDFRDLQREWREIGLVPQSKMKNLWDTYHFHVENFYDYIKINRELRDLDLKKNLEAKIKLCESAEELLVEEPSILKAFNTLQKYHEQWREIGPVPREQKDDIWERFKAATTKINKKHQEFFENRKVDQKKNLEAKTALCEKAEEITQGEISNHREWDERSKQLIELQKVWRTIGFAPRKDNNKIYERFRTACDAFFNAKRAFYAKNKEEQQNNLQLKTDLCVQAESLKDSDDWKKTTQDFINIQKKWKEIGPVPRKHSDALWKRFRAACDFFFDKKSEHFSDVDTEQDDNLKLKEDLIKEVENFKPVEKVDKNLESLKAFQRRWTEIGHVPFKKKDEIKVQFRDAINKLFDDLNLDDERRNLLKFRNKMSSFSESMRGQNKMRMERDKYMSKMKQLENDLVLLDNNVGFFAKSKNAESLIADVKKKIEVTKQKIELLKDKIRVIDEMDND
ncbi:DUF349 domain-containing protein [Draconibacterium halophilum]|uniref:DUF349 domain-containing protein n=1 Tax=Draconibacterium halophilum TaxID=2706887 RepID=A0A6C0RF08_9BACT|nr:DUF349 domain-containing protein [Draconibacterium halophilum]QIA08265.1 DUF349 domain-containing protein [Draconibacterium halophilum]